MSERLKVNVYLTVSIRGKSMESKKIVGVSGLGLALLLGTQGAMAQVAVQPQAIPFGSFVLVPTLAAQTVYDDNIYGLHDGEVGSFSQILNPNLALVAQDRLNVYTANYGLKAASYANDSNDSYADQQFRLSAHVEPDSRLRLNGNVAYSMLHDDRGSGASSGFDLVDIRAIGEVDKYDSASIGAGLEYGAKDARGLAVLTAEMAQKRYDRNALAIARDNDRLSTLLGLRARVMPKTTVLIDYERVDTNYKADVLAGGVNDTLDTRLLLGLVWENTAQTTGKLRLGKGKRDTDNQKDISKFTWDLGVTWSPQAFDSITLDAGSRVSDANQPYTSVESTNYSVSWTHDWLARFNTVVSLGSSKDDYRGNPLPVDDRSDDSKTYGVAANYQMRRWLVLSAGVNTSDRSSDIKAFDTKRSVMSVGAQISL
jgi:hypothetical protein